MIKKIFTSVVIVSFIFYGYVLCRLLFRGFYGVSMMFSEHLMIRQGYNLVPFKTIAEYITAFLDGRMRGVAFRNLAGNLFLLTPLGFYMPFFAKKTKKVISYMVVIAVLIVTIEVVQLATMSGSLDIDDFILNFIGALIGFLIFKCPPFRSLFKLRVYGDDDVKRYIAKLKNRAKQLKVDIPAVFIALKRKDTPLPVKVLAFVTIAYALSPIDLIPDFIPVLGFLDDALILPCLVALIMKLIPAEIFAECRTEAEGLWDDCKPKKWYYALPIVFIWLFIVFIIVKAVWL